MATANDRQVAGAHYVKHGGLQHWDIVAKFNLDYFQGQITKYVMRFRDKNGIQDLEKARHFLDKLIELETAKVEREVDAVRPPGDHPVYHRTVKEVLHDQGTVFGCCDTRIDYGACNCLKEAKEYEQQYLRVEQDGHGFGHTDKETK